MSAWDDQYDELLEGQHEVDVWDVAEPEGQLEPIELDEANKPRKHYPELAPYMNDDYIHEMLKQDANFGQRCTIGLCQCCGASGHFVAACFGATVAMWWWYIAADAYLEDDNLMVEQMVVYLLTGLCGFGLCLSSVYVLSMDTHKILACLLSNFKRKLDYLSDVTNRLDVTEEKLADTNKDLVSQTDRLRDLVNAHEKLVQENKSLHDEHNQICNKYKTLVQEYDATITEQQKILSGTLLAVANLHQQGSDQIHSLLKEMSKVTGESKEAAAEFGKSFLEVDRLKSELGELRNALNVSIKDLNGTTKRNHELADKLSELTNVLPKLLTEKNAMDRKHISLDRRSEDLVHLLRDLVRDRSDKTRATTLPDNSHQKNLLRLSLEPLPMPQPVSRHHQRNKSKALKRRDATKAKKIHRTKNHFRPKSIDETSV